MALAAVSPLIFYVTPAQNFREIISIQQNYIDKKISKSEFVILSLSNTLFF